MHNLEHQIIEKSNKSSRPRPTVRKTSPICMCCHRNLARKPDTDTPRLQHYTNSTQSLSRCSYTHSNNNTCH